MHLPKQTEKRKRSLKRKRFNLPTTIYTIYFWENFIPTLTTPKQFHIYKMLWHWQNQRLTKCLFPTKYLNADRNKTANIGSKMGPADRFIPPYFCRRH